MLGCEHAIKQPPGLRRLILASSPSDLPYGVIEVNLLRDQLPFGRTANLVETRTSRYDGQC